MRDVPFLQDIIDSDEFTSSAWLYLDGKRNQVGPVSYTALRKSFQKEGIISTDTLVWREGMAEWKTISSIPYLLKLLSEGTITPSLMLPAEVEGSRSDINNNANTSFIGEDGNVYLWDEDSGMWQQQESSKKGSTSLATAANKSFTAEDGNIYTWDDDLGMWQQDEGEDNNGVTMELDSSGNVGVDVRKRKRKSKPKIKVPVSSVYVQGLPPDTNEEEVTTYFQKCGVIRIDPITDAPSVKLYRNDAGDLKGDALVSYLRHESVGLAIQMLGGFDMRDG